MPRSRRWSLIIYAMFLSLLAMALAYAFVSKSEVLMQNLSIQEYDSKLSRSVVAKSGLVLKWAASLNADGRGFKPARECPQSVTLSGSLGTWSTRETLATFPRIRNGKLACEGTSSAGTTLRLDYSPDFTTFLTGTYVNSVSVNPSWANAPGSSLGGTFSDPDRKILSFALPSAFSDYDGDLDSDDYRPTSTGASAYPDGYRDDDADARASAAGLVRNDSGWNLAFWENPKTSAVIARNANNSGALFEKPSETSTGYLRFEIDRPFSIRVVEFDTGAFLSAGELRKVSVTQADSSTGATGYLQNDLTFSGSRSPGDNAKAFDFKNRDYAVFLSYPAAYSGSVTHLKYRISWEASSGKGIWLVPIDDSSPDIMRHLGSDILIDPTGNYRYKFLETSVPKIASVP